MPRRRRRIVLLHADCRGELKRGPLGVWTCQRCGGKVDIGEYSIANYRGIPPEFTRGGFSIVGGKGTL